MKLFEYTAVVLCCGFWGQGQSHDFCRIVYELSSSSRTVLEDSSSSRLSDITNASILRPIPKLMPVIFEVEDNVLEAKAKIFVLELSLKSRSFF